MPTAVSVCNGHDGTLFKLYYHECEANHVRQGYSGIIMPDVNPVS